MKVRFA